MGKVWMPGGGGGADLDIVTAGKPDVLAGKVIVDKDGEPLTGTMPDRGAISTLLGINGSYTIPEGYHNGSGKVTQSISTMGGQTVNPTASQQIVSTNGKYLTGNVTVNGVTNLSAANIKKGVNVGGIVGTFEGYVPTPTDLYLRGNNIANWARITANVSLDSGQITLLEKGPGTIYAYINMTGYNWLVIEGYHNRSVGETKSIKLLKDGASSDNQVGYLDLTSYGAGNYTVAFNVSALQVYARFYLQFYTLMPAVYRIWLS